MLHFLLTFNYVNNNIRIQTIKFALQSGINDRPEF